MIFTLTYKIILKSFNSQLLSKNTKKLSYTLKLFKIFNVLRFQNAGFLKFTNIKFLLKKIDLRRKFFGKVTIRIF